jgi:hypothetical protein
VSRQNLIMIGAVVVLALIAFLVAGPVVALLLLLIGGAGVYLLVKRDSEGQPRGAGKKFFDTEEGTAATARSVAPPAGEGLPTWGGDALPTWGGAETTDDAGWATDADAEPLTTWDDSSIYGETTYEATSFTETPSYEAPTYEPPAYDTPTYEAPAAAEETSWSSDDSWSSDSWGSDTVVEDEPVVEAPAAHVTSLFGGGGRPAPINEEVSTADEIMEASKATELHIGEAPDDAPAAVVDDNSELAKLLAKVQARLAVYE